MVTTRSAERKAASASRVTDLALRSRSIRPSSAVSTPSCSPRKRAGSAPVSPAERAKRARVDASNAAGERVDATKPDAEDLVGAEMDEGRGIVKSLAAETQTDSVAEAVARTPSGSAEGKGLEMSNGREDSEDDDGAPVAEAVKVVKNVSTPGKSKGKVKGESPQDEEAGQAARDSDGNTVMFKGFLSEQKVEASVTEKLQLGVNHDAESNKGDDVITTPGVSEDKVVASEQLLQMREREEKTVSLALSSETSPKRLLFSKRMTPGKFQLQRATPRQVDLPAKPRNSLSLFRADQQRWRVNRAPVKWAGKSARFTVLV